MIFVKCHINGRSRIITVGIYSWNALYFTTDVHFRVYSLVSLLFVSVIFLIYNLLITRFCRRPFQFVSVVFSFVPSSQNPIFYIFYFWDIFDYFHVVMFFFEIKQHTLLLRIKIFEWGKTLITEIIRKQQDSHNCIEQ